MAREDFNMIAFVYRLQHTIPVLKLTLTDTQADSDSILQSVLLASLIKRPHHRVWVGSGHETSPYVASLWHIPHAWQQCCQQQSKQSEQWWPIGRQALIWAVENYSFQPLNYDQYFLSHKCPSGSMKVNKSAVPLFHQRLWKHENCDVCVCVCCVCVCMCVCVCVCLTVNSSVSLFCI